ncbi:hypothetical protein Ait01nite_094020 [Actinoplanes italicus]|uniref:Uncharacterized protein n=1 Tax=Actinoplanes italicus TaxID=113567 RepID=A0A2T0JPA9_9ACTN|nr:hypothetical protein [Actinoplanes italicus]PRX09452.1 hypothetical protein CLV67_13628 [Actinoplanes italicus]GIE36357.1 hypothetical protein Ait01nite_094020 [Actinoplanes italicus]
MATTPDDPHIHVEAGARSSAAARNLLASTFGLVAELPAQVATGCGRQVPRAMTSGVPESVTCLPCREHAAEQHLRLADLAATLGPLPGSPISVADAHQAAAHHRDLARRFDT